MEDPHPSAAKKQRLSGVSKGVIFAQCYISSIDHFKEKSRRNNVVFCATGEPDCYELFGIFQMDRLGYRRFDLGSCEQWFTRKWPLVAALSIKTPAPRLNGKAVFFERRYSDAVSAMRHMLANPKNFGSSQIDTFYILDNVFYDEKSGQEKNMENVVEKALDRICLFTPVKFLVCRGKSLVKEIKGDLLESSRNLAHCVSEDLKMSAGIAKKFREKFDNVEELRCQNKTVGEVAVLKQNSRFIYYLVTKEFYYYKPTYEDVRNSLVEMRKHALLNDITNISMPAIGCGLDQLDWDRMKLIIKEVFLPTDIEITIYFLDKDVN